MLVPTLLRSRLRMSISVEFELSKNGSFIKLWRRLQFLHG